MATSVMEQVAVDALQWPCVSVANPCNHLLSGTGVPNQGHYARKVLAVVDSTTLIRAAEVVPNDENRLKVTSSVVPSVLGERCLVQLLLLLLVAAVAANPPCSVEKGRSSQSVAPKLVQPGHFCHLEETQET